MHSSTFDFPSFQSSFQPPQQFFNYQQQEHSRSTAKPTSSSSSKHSKPSSWDEYFLGKCSYPPSMDEPFFGDFMFPRGTTSFSQSATSFTPFGPPFAYNIPSPLSSQNNDKKYESMKYAEQHHFFATLLLSIQQANKCYNIRKPSSWKNPFLYKTSLCSHWRLQGFCRYAENCWYAHGMVELRFVPRMTEIPSPECLLDMLSHLGLPQHVLKTIILNAYRIVGINPSTPSKDPEDPFAYHLTPISNMATPPSSSGTSPSDSMHPQSNPTHGFNFLQPPWSATASASTTSPADDGQTSVDSGFSLFGDNYASAFL